MGNIILTILFIILSGFPLIYIFSKQIKKNKIMLADNKMPPISYRDLTNIELSQLKKLYDSSLFSKLKFKKDLIDKVYRIEGHVFKEKAPQGKGNPWASIVSVRGVEFYIDTTNNNEVNFFDKVKTNDLVRIEYSPNSRHIWKMEAIK